MLHKTPKTNFARLAKKGAAIIILAEVVTFGLSYGLWNRLNTDIDFRFYMHNNYPWALDKYYSFGELLSGDSSPRQLDYNTWKQNIDK